MRHDAGHGPLQALGDSGREWAKVADAGFDETRHSRAAFLGKLEAKCSLAWWLLRKGWLSRRWESMPGGQAGCGARARAGGGLRRWRPRWWRARA
jgi:hypothetical protein